MLQKFREHKTPVSPTCVVSCTYIYVVLFSWWDWNIKIKSILPYHLRNLTPEKWNIVSSGRRLYSHRQGHSVECSNSIHPVAIRRMCHRSAYRLSSLGIAREIHVNIGYSKEVPHQALFKCSEDCLFLQLTYSRFWFTINQRVRDPIFIDIIDRWRHAMPRWCFHRFNCNFKKHLLFRTVHICTVISGKYSTLY